MDTRSYLVSAVEDKHRGGSSFCFRSAPYPGKGRKMKKLNDFEYDLWTTEDGKCMVRVRLTKEECQVDRETFRLLRAEEKRLRRERTPEKKKTASNQPFSMEQTRCPLSLQTLCPGDDEEEGEFWLIDPNNMEDIITTKLLEEAFLATLTPHQAEVYHYCVAGRMGKSQYAAYCGVSPASVSKAIRKIQTSAKKFFGRG